MENGQTPQSVRTSYLVTTGNTESVNITKFSNLVADSIIDGIRSAVNSRGTKQFLFHARLRSHKIDPKKVHSDLYSLLGAGSEIVEKSVVQQLFQKLGLPFHENEFDFESSLNLAMVVYRTRAKEVDLV